ncbi:MAG: filamentous hemagglutinin N-terminal domain-containing protein, partial [Coleofasciculaceae cyanobacterium]
MITFFCDRVLPLFCLTSSLFLYSLVNTIPSQAQISSDGTTNTLVTSDGNTFVIESGTSVGTNLFHSFQEFSLPTGQEAFFNNGTTIENIVGRVTGGNASEINGLIKTNGTANLFLINPLGIIFGPNAQLDIGGSFFASTAESIKFTDGSSFGVNSSTAPLLTLNVPIGLQFGSNPGRISNQSRAINSSGEVVGLQVPVGQSLALIGGDVSLVGGQLTAPQGQIEIGSVASNSLVNLTPTASSFSLGYEAVENFSDIELLQQAVINANGAGGGTIQMQGANISLTDNSQVVADTLGNVDGGGIFIRANQLTVQEGAFVSASTFGEGAGGSLNVKASSLNITSDGKLQELLDQLFSGQTILPSQFGSGLFSLSYSVGRANDLSVETENLSLREGALISTTPFDGGRGGDMMVKVSESIELIGSEFLANSFGDGDAGLVTVETSKLFISEGAGIFASTSGAGQAGT